MKRVHIGDLPKLQSIDLGDNVFNCLIDVIQEGDGGSQEDVDSDREDVESDREDADSDQEDLDSSQEESDSNHDESNSNHEDNTQVTSQHNLQPQIILTMKSMFYCVLYQRSSCIIIIQRRRVLLFQLQRCHS